MRTGASPAVPGIEELEPIGRGGFATVYRGWQAELNRPVAVKVLDATAMDAGAAARFRREVMAMGALSDHPHVVPVYTVGSVGDRLYLVMPFLEGSLADELTAGPLAPDAVVELGLGLADALAAAHRSGVLHRDVKPANVLRSAYGTAKLSDFGVARFVDNTNTNRGQLMATVAYAAPEVLSGEPASEASDVY
ncbi:MAG: serine/threonine protein kinase, partial [Actinomycetota bacterium]|nr:serine/threonine protein kinase [Actinomycetota bacterium]